MRKAVVNCSGKARAVHQRLGLAAAILCLWVGMAVPPPSEASFPGRNGDIGFTIVGSDPDSGDERGYLRAVSPAGALERQFARRADRACPDCRDGAYSPSARELAVLGPDGIEILSVDSSRHRLLRGGGNPRSPAWSPGGTRIAFVDDDLGGSGGESIYAVGVNGRRLRRLAGGREPVWSSTGQIAFQRDDGIYVMSVDGSAIRRVRAANCFQAVSCRVDWSPDGRKLAYSDAESGYIGVMTASGRRLRRLTRGHADLPDLNPVWSPDGRQVAFVRADPRTEAQGIAVVPGRGGAVRTLVPPRAIEKVVFRAWSKLAVGYLDWQPLAHSGSSAAAPASGGLATTGHYLRLGAGVGFALVAAGFMLRRLAR